MRKEPTNEELMKAAAFDGMDMVISPNGGHLVVVAVQNGAKVCWQCGVPFDENDRRFRLVEKLNDVDTTVPVGVHAKCVDPAVSVSIGTSLRKVAAGIREKVKLSRVLNAADRIAVIASENAKKIVM